MIFSNKKVIYLDNAATTSLDPAVTKVMLPFFEEKIGNASSTHTRGREAKEAMENARKTIAKSIFNFYDQFEDTNDLNELNRLYKYRERHGLRFALRGYDVADIYIGKVGEYHTISLCDKENDWSYNIDMRQFIIDCKKMYDGNDINF